MKIGPAVVDAFAGSTLAFAITAALYQRGKTGKGCRICVSMLASALNLLEQNLVDFMVSLKEPHPAGNHDTAIAPFGVFKTADGSVVLAAGSEILWQELVAVLKKHGDFTENLYTTNELRLANLPKLVKSIEQIFMNMTTSLIIEELRARNIPCARIATMKDVCDSPWFFNTGALKKVTHPVLGDLAIPYHSIRFEPAA